VAAEKVTTAQKVELAHQLCWPHGPYSKSQVARALGIARGTLYLNGKQAVKDKKIATAIEEWHEQDDTMGHRKLAALLKTGKNLVKRVMKKYGIAARRKKKRYVYPGKASSIAPNVLRDPQTPAEQEVMFSDIFEIHLADRTKVRGCFALWKRTRHCLSLAFDYQMADAHFGAYSSLVAMKGSFALLQEEGGRQMPESQTSKNCAFPADLKKPNRWTAPMLVSDAIG
jgi:predicted transcriptional regulator